MPVKKVKSAKGKSCYKWGDSGKVYCGGAAKTKALRQARAAFANGYRQKEKVSKTQ